MYQHHLEVTENDTCQPRVYDPHHQYHRNAFEEDHLDNSRSDELPNRSAIYRSRFSDEDLEVPDGHSNALEMPRGSIGNPPYQSHTLPPVWKEDSSFSRPQREHDRLRKTVGRKDPYTTSERDSLTRTRFISPYPGPTALKAVRLGSSVTPNPAFSSLGTSWNVQPGPAHSPPGDERYHPVNPCPAPHIQLTRTISNSPILSSNPLPAAPQSNSVTPGTRDGCPAANLNANGKRRRVRKRKRKTPAASTAVPSEIFLTSSPVDQKQKPAPRTGVTTISNSEHVPLVLTTSAEELKHLFQEYPDGLLNQKSPGTLMMSTTLHQSSDKSERRLDELSGSRKSTDNIAASGKIPGKKSALRKPAAVLRGNLDQVSDEIINVSHTTDHPHVTVATRKHIPEAASSTRSADDHNITELDDSSSFIIIDDLEMSNGEKIIEQISEEQNESCSRREKSVNHGGVGKGDIPQSEIAVSQGSSLIQAPPTKVGCTKGNDDPSMVQRSTSESSASDPKLVNTDPLEEQSTSTLAAFLMREGGTKRKRDDDTASDDSYVTIDNFQMSKCKRKLARLSDEARKRELSRQRNRRIRRKMSDYRKKLDKQLEAGLINSHRYNRLLQSAAQRFPKPRPLPSKVQPPRPSSACFQPPRPSSDKYQPPRSSSRRFQPPQTSLNSIHSQPGASHIRLPPPSSIRFQPPSPPIHHPYQPPQHISSHFPPPHPIPDDYQSPQHAYNHFKPLVRQFTASHFQPPQPTSGISQSIDEQHSPNPPHEYPPAPALKAPTHTFTVFTRYHRPTTVDEVERCLFFNPQIVLTSIKASMDGMIVIEADSIRNATLARKQLIQDVFQISDVRQTIVRAIIDIPATYRDVNPEVFLQGLTSRNNLPPLSLVFGGYAKQGREGIPGRGGVRYLIDVDKAAVPILENRDWCLQMVCGSFRLKPMPDA